MEVSKNNKNKDKLNKEIGERIGIARTQCKEKYSQEKVAQKLGIARVNYTAIENGNRRININQIIELSKLFNVSTDYLLGLLPEPSKNVEIKAINEKYGLSKKALINLEAMQQHKFFDDTLIDTTNKLLEQSFYINNNGNSIISIIDSYFEENGEGKTLTFRRRNGMETTISGNDVLKVFFVLLENELINMKEGIKDEHKGTRKK